VIREIVASVLEAYGFQKPPSAAAIRMQRYRERKRNESVTPKGQKRNGASQERNDTSPVVVTIPLIGDVEHPVTQNVVDEFSKSYPAVDVGQTLLEIRAWCMANPTLRKTPKGVMRFLNSWLSREQNKAWR